MNRRVAKIIHETTNITYWMEDPDWKSGNPAFDLSCKLLRTLPFSIHEAQKRAFFDVDKLIAVSGESVVVANSTDKVDKFMFRYPGKMPLEIFRNHVALEVGAVTNCLAGVALPTEVTIKPADIFKRHRNLTSVVTQTQRRLDLSTNPIFDLRKLAEKPSATTDKSVRDIERMLLGTEILAKDYDFTPDIAYSSGNLRQNIYDGTVTLIDVMPIHSDGSRLIGDRPPDLLEHTLANIQSYQTFVGQYGG